MGVVTRVMVGTGRNRTDFPGSRLRGTRRGYVRCDMVSGYSPYVSQALDARDAARARSLSLVIYGAVSRLGIPAASLPRLWLAARPSPAGPRAVIRHALARTGHRWGLAFSLPSFYPGGGVCVAGRPAGQVSGT
jgi:hypothetical protein